jgi:hypothetical protein
MHPLLDASSDLFLFACSSDLFACLAHAGDGEKSPRASGLRSGGSSARALVRTGETGMSQQQVRLCVSLRTARLAWRNGNRNHIPLVVAQSGCCWALRVECCLMQMAARKSLIAPGQAGGAPVAPQLSINTGDD